MINFPDIWKDNFSAKSRILSWIRKANGIGKYNPSLHRVIEDAIGEPSDRGVEDTGEEPIHANYEHIESDPTNNEPY